jgi:hypothetical protein
MNVSLWRKRTFIEVERQESLGETMNRKSVATVSHTAFLILTGIFGCHAAFAQGSPQERALAGLDETRGLRVNQVAASPGYVLFDPILSNTTYLIDNEGQVVHTWQSDYAPEGSSYIRDNGNLIRGGREPMLHDISAGGQGGNIQEFTWDGELLWQIELNTESELLHHDIEILPNGNVLAIAWEVKTAEESRLAGRRPNLIPEGGLWPDMVIEYEPRPPDRARVVWEWHSWDHLIQDFDAELDNYGVLAEHPGRIDINGEQLPPTAEELALLRSRGYIDSEAEPFENSDIMHTNGIHYDAELDQIVLSIHNYHELWVIDHSTTTEAAAGTTGGRYGMGGDLLYRWGNPRVYGRGTEDDRLMGGQHDARWIPGGFPGAGNILVFNNNAPGPDGALTSVIEIETPIDENGHYRLSENAAFAPAHPAWTYTALNFRAPFISGAHRLLNGNTLITSGPRGRFIEVTSGQDSVWEYWTPYSGEVFLPDGSRPQPIDFNVFAVFRATRIPPDHPALAGRNLEPMNPQPPIIPPTYPED